MKLKFTKMHGIGNDFVVIDGFDQTVSLTGEQIKLIADRHFGVGCDQLLMVEQPTIENVDFRYRIFNADGGEVEQCGNGARCFVRFVHDKNLTDKTEIRVQTAGGIITLKLQTDGQVTVSMGAPRFTPSEIPFTAQAEQLQYPLIINGETIEIAAVSMGNPHAVQIVENTDDAPVAIQGPLIESHAMFPNRVNAGFMQIVDHHHIRLRVFERGSGETLACGTGACAAVVSGIRLNRLISPVSVEMLGGQLQIEWTGDGQPVWMTGPAQIVFDGEIEIN
jgi:diaminopimelate epimerase